MAESSLVLQASGGRTAGCSSATTSAQWKRDPYACSACETAHYGRSLQGARPLQNNGLACRHTLALARDFLQAFCIVGLPPSDSTTYKMILTQCAVCATELGLSLGKKCGRCSTRYCGPECQKQHWEEGGHDQLCKLIKKAGGAEQYNANNKYAEAVAVAVEKCADDTKGQTCFICTQALHWKTKEGPRAHVRVPRDGGFFARVVPGGAGEDFGRGGRGEQFGRQGDECEVGSVVLVQSVRARLPRRREMCARLGVLENYLGRPETDDQPRCLAMNVLGLGLGAAGHHEDALSVREAELAVKRRLGATRTQILSAQSNIAANTYNALGRLDEALSMQRDIYSGRLKLNGEEHEKTVIAANNCALTLNQLKRFEEAKSCCAKTMPVARRVLGVGAEVTLRMRWSYARALFQDPAATLDDLREAVTTLEDAGTDRAARARWRSHPVDIGDTCTTRESPATSGVDAALRAPASARRGARAPTGIQEPSLPLRQAAAGATAPPRPWASRASAPAPPNPRRSPPI